MEKTRTVILFPHEARAAATGTLRQIWRPLPVQPDHVINWDGVRLKVWHNGETGYACPDYDPGDVLACREAWRIGAWRDDSRFALDYKASPELKRTPWVLCPDESEALGLRNQTLFELGMKGILPTDGTHRWEPGEAPLYWRSPATMPAWAVRSYVKTLAVTVKRVQEMTEEDAKAWGILKNWPGAKHSFPEGDSLLDNAHAIWNFHHSHRGLGVPGNPWCWAYAVEQAGRTEEHHG